MELPFIVAFVGICAISAFRRPWAFALVLLMFPMEQVMQAHCPALRSGVAAQAVNYGVALSSLFACARMTLRGGGLVNWMNTVMLATIGLYLWSIITLLWSPGRTEGLETIGTQWPYFFLIILVSPLLIRDINDTGAALRAFLWIGLPLGFVIAFSPEFASKYGRIGFEIGMGYRSNPLAIGELGGGLLVIGATLRKGVIPVAGTIVRIVAVILGAMVAIKAGSRGQFFIAIVVAIVFIPVSAPLRNPVAFVSSVVGIGVVLAAASVLLSSELDGFAAKRFSSDEMLYGESSVSGRLSNFFILAEAYLRSPTAIFVGLGYSTFTTLPGGMGEPYSHVLFADALFELGIPGAVLMSTIIWVGCRSSYQLLKQSVDDPLRRAVLATVGALLAYQILLVNKQGSLWGTPILFPLLTIMLRVYLNEQTAHPEQSNAIET